MLAGGRPGRSGIACSCFSSPGLDSGLARSFHNIDCWTSLYLRSAAAPRICSLDSPGDLYRLRKQAAIAVGARLGVWLARFLTTSPPSPPHILGAPEAQTLFHRSARRPCWSRDGFIETCARRVAP